MRILIIAPPWLTVPPVGYGGTETVIAELTAELVRSGHEVTLFSTGESAIDGAEAAWVYPEAVTLRSFAPVAELRQALAARQFASGRAFDVIHDHTMAGAALQEEVPTVFTQHNRFTEESEDLFRHVIHRGAHIVAISQAHASESTLPIDAVIHHGVDVSRFPVGEGSGGYLAFLGRMSPDKGVREAIDIARTADLPLRIAAKMHEDEEIDYFHEEIAHLVGDGVEFVGELDFDGKVAFVGDALALLNPIQWSEPFGMTSIEAMACGTPVLTTPFGAAPEIVVDGVTGYVRDGDDLADCAAKVGQIERQLCRQHVEQNFSVAKMTEKYVRLYEQVANA
jgi:glycosyltransferase involved in cell wall biosynthesis